MRLPLMVIARSGWARGEAEPIAMASSQGKSMPSDATWARNSATVLSDGMRVSLIGSAIDARESGRRWQQWPDISRDRKLNLEVALSSFPTFDLANPCYN